MYCLLTFSHSVHLLLPSLALGFPIGILPHQHIIMWIFCSIQPMALCPDVSLWGLSSLSGILSSIHTALRAFWTSVLLSRAIIWWHHHLLLWNHSPVGSQLCSSCSGCIVPLQSQISLLCAHHIFLSWTNIVSTLFHTASLWVATFPLAYPALPVL
jgi:hypothetical protein